MPQSFHEIEKGLELNSAVFLSGTGVPGLGGDSDVVGPGSYYTKTDSPSGLYVKLTAGTGTDKWEKLATETFASSSAGSPDWKDSVRVATTVLLPNNAAGSGVGKTLTGVSNGILNIDGVQVLLGDRVAVKNQAASPGHVDHGIYECTQEGTAIQPFILTRATDADEDTEVTANLSFSVEEGTVNAGSYWSLVTNDVITVDTTQLDFVQIASANTELEFGFIRTFIGKGNAGNETPGYSSNNYVANGTSLEAAIGVLDSQLGTTVSELNTAEAEILEARTETLATNVTASTVIDSVDVNQVVAVKWIVYAEGFNLIDADKKGVIEILATHDGYNQSGGADATQTDYTSYAKLRIGTLIGLSADVTLSGSGGSQIMRLEVSSTTSVNIKAIREVINF